MGSLPRQAGLLGAVMAFCTAALSALLCSCPPLTALKRGGVCALVVGLLVWAGVWLALGVVRDGLRQAAGEEEP
ncbi:MAG: hypothetical protein R6V05_12980 [Candidatus Brocadiia bacterium]